MSTMDSILSGRKNKKARELISSAEQMMSEIENEICDTDKLFEDDLSVYKELREDVSSHSLKTFDDTYIEIKNVEFKGSIVTYTDDKMEDIGGEFCNCKKDIKPVVIEKVDSGFFGAITGGLFAGVATLSAAVAFVVIKTGMQIDTKQIPTPEQINSVIEYFGSLIKNGNTDLINGSYMLGGTSAVVALIVGCLILNKKSNKNLLIAESTFSEATATHLEKTTQNRKTISMAEYIETLENNLKTLKIYMDEYNAVLKRIIHVEGTDYSTYSIRSQSSIHTALSIYKRIKSLISTKVVDTEGSISPASRYEVDKSSSFLKDLAEKES